MKNKTFSISAPYSVSKITIITSHIDERQLLPFIAVVSSLYFLHVGLRSHCSPPAVAREWNTGVTLLNFISATQLSHFTLRNDWIIPTIG